MQEDPKIHNKNSRKNKSSHLNFLRSCTLDQGYRSLHATVFAMICFQDCDCEVFVMNILCFSEKTEATLHKFLVRDFV
jgi:hypothetical protein